MTVDSPQPIWRPENPEHSQLAQFQHYIAKKYSRQFDTYHDLWEWSTSHIAQFWFEVYHYLQIKGVNPPTSPDDVVDENVPNMFPRPTWFKATQLNFAENLLFPAPEVQEPESTIAIIEASENGVQQRITWTELRNRVAQFAAALRACGVGKGDRVGGMNSKRILANTPHAVVAFLATASVGALWSCTSPDFGAHSILDRLSQIEPKILLADNAVLYNGREHDALAKISAVAKGIRSLEKVVVFPNVKSHSMDISCIPNSVASETFLSVPTTHLKFAPLPFDHPLIILYSSGTTGLPKPIVHAAGPLLLQLKKEHVFHCNFTPNDRFFQFTTCAWMMWPWLIGAMSAGTSILVFDGSPFKPSPLSLWELCDSEGVSAFGTSAKYLESLEQAQVFPRMSLHDAIDVDSHFSLRKLRLIMSTGSVLPPSSFEFVYKAFPSKVQLSSITGGTDICSLFGAPCPLLPVYTGEIQCRALGMAVSAFDDTGAEAPINHPGELVCTRIFPVMPVCFWGKDGEEKYRKSYFATFPGIWHHGDYVIVTRAGGLLMLGRSDSILNPAGVRFGSAEIYNVLGGRFAEDVSDSVCVGQQREGEADERVLLFVKMADGKKLTSELVGILKKGIRDDLSPRHVPALIVQCPDIPYTVNGKKIEVAVKNILCGRTVKVSNTVANPESLKWFEEWMKENN